MYIKFVRFKWLTQSQRITLQYFTSNHKFEFTTYYTLLPDLYIIFNTLHNSVQDFEAHVYLLHFCK